MVYGRQNSRRKEVRLAAMPDLPLLSTTQSAPSTIPSAFVLPANPPSPFAFTIASSTYLAEMPSAPRTKPILSVAYAPQAAAAIPTLAATAAVLATALEKAAAARIACSERGGERRTKERKGGACEREAAHTPIDSVHAVHAGVACIANWLHRCSGSRCRHHDRGTPWDAVLLLLCTPFWATETKMYSKTNQGREQGAETEAAIGRDSG